MLNRKLNYNILINILSHIGIIDIFVTNFLCSKTITRIQMPYDRPQFEFIMISIFEIQCIAKGLLCVVVLLMKQTTCRNAIKFY